MNAPRARSRRASLQFQHEALEQVPVRIGEVKVASGSSVLFTIGLGSCVAIALFDDRARVGGLAHAMLPRPERGHRTAPPGRFVTTAMPVLLDMLEREGAVRSRLRARLAGGASMFQAVLEGEGLRLGRRNVEAAQEALAAAGVPVDGVDVHGTHGRSVFLRTSDGTLLVTSVSNEDVYL
ncbi:MAG TPA: chemotaxis protein CheD [Longimicrobiales bacterium]|nr:chemotaxis protein CheD [Longimicrobiales bacterium]